MLFKGKHGGVPPIFRTLILVQLKVVGLCCNFFEVGASIPLGAATGTNLSKENQKKDGFWSILLKVKYGGVTLIFSTWFFCLFVCLFGCCICNNEKPAIKSGSLKIKTNCGFVIIFQEQIWWSAPTIQNSNFSSSERGLVCCNIFFGSRCIHSFRSCHHLYKFKQRKPEKKKILVNTVGSKIRQSAFNFFHMYLFIILRAPQKHSE